MQTATKPIAIAVTSVDERRGHTRIPCALEVRCCSLDGTEWPALAVNVSAHGARLVSFLSDPPPALEYVLLRNRKGFAVEVPARLVHAQGSRNLWMMGCQFLNPLSDEDLAKLVPSSARRRA
jgi:hypothetical protein